MAYSEEISCAISILCPHDMGKVPLSVCAKCKHNHGYRFVYPRVLIECSFFHDRYFNYTNCEGLKE